MSSGNSFPERMNSFAAGRRSIVPPQRSIVVVARTICHVEIDVMWVGNRFPERMNRLTTAMTTFAARQTSITDGAATIAAVAMRVIADQTLGVLAITCCVASAVFSRSAVPGPFVVGESLRPRGRPPAPPRIYTREELRLLLDGALSHRNWERWHRWPIRSKTMHAIILLLATSGLRISEALHLTLQDVDLEAGVLSIRQSKFRKSRLVPLSAGTPA